MNNAQEATNTKLRRNSPGVGVDVGVGVGIVSQGVNRQWGGIYLEMI